MMHIFVRSLIALCCVVMLLAFAAIAFGTQRHAFYAADGEIAAWPTAPAAPTATLTPTRTPLPTLTPLPPPPHPLKDQHVTAQVVEVLDGDTIKVEVAGQPYRVELLGINTPRRGLVAGEPHCFGPEAAEATQQLLEGKTVVLEKDVSEIDEQGRLPRHVYTVDDQGQKLHVNWELVRRGYAVVRLAPPDLKYQEAFQQAQWEAQATQQGLWAPETCNGLR